MPIPIRHGMAKPRTRAYIAWLSMIQRMTNTNHKQFADYGGRFDFDPHWRDFINFHADMGECPPGFQLERENNDLGYWPWNCCWADRITQQNNRRCTAYLTIGGERLPLMEWSRRSGLSQAVLIYRRDMNWPESEMLSPATKRRVQVIKKRRAA